MPQLRTSPSSDRPADADVLDVLGQLPRLDVRLLFEIEALSRVERPIVLELDCAELLGRA
jgi:hypothetical protein